MYEWKVAVDRPIYAEVVRIYVWRQTDNTHKEFLVKGGFESKTIEARGVTDKEKLWFAEFPNTETGALALEALEAKGLPLPSKHQIAGKLDATERHLEDMRRLVFEEPRHEQIAMAPIDLGDDK